jgi:hypothetical protein
MSRMDEKLVDRRTVERNIQKGLISQKEYDTFVQTLPDVKDLGEVIDVGAAGDDEDDSEE